MFLLLAATLFTLATAGVPKIDKISADDAEASSYFKAYGPAAKQRKQLLDGNLKTRLHTNCGKKEWIGVRFTSKCFVKKIKFTNGKYNSYRHRIDNAKVVVKNGKDGKDQECGKVKVGNGGSFEAQTYEMECPSLFGDRIRMINAKGECTELSEFEAFGYCSCEAGSFLDSKKGCVKCAEGQFSGDGAVTCSKCPKNHFTDKTGSTKCTPCPSGKEAKTEGSKECSWKPCSAGMSLDVSKGCVACPLGFYSTDGTKCEKCATGEFSEEGSTSKDACTPYWKGYKYTNATGSYSVKDMGDCAFICSKIDECKAITFDNNAKKCSLVILIGTDEVKGSVKSEAHFTSVTIKDLKANPKYSALLAGGCDKKSTTVQL